MNISKITNHLALCILAIAFWSSCAKQGKISEYELDKERIEKYLLHLQKRHEIPGISVAIIKDSTVLYQKQVGKSNIEHNVPMDDSAIFRVYSLTKPIISVGVFQLIEKGMLSLEDSIGKYVKNLPDTWSSIKVQHLLTHSSGLPDMAPYARLEKLTEQEAKALVFSKDVEAVGAKYSYNQTNFWLLQLIIEAVTGQLLEDFILENQFNNDREKVFFSSDSRDIVPNRVTAYFPFQTGTRQISHPSLKGRYMYAANGLNVTMDAFIDWNARLWNNKLLSKETRDQMWKEFDYERSDKLFTYGWDKRIINAHDSFGFSGSLITAYRVFPKDNLSIIFLSNGLGNYYNIENIINHIASIVDKDIVDVNNAHFEALLQPIVEQDIEIFKKTFHNLVKDYSISEQLQEGLINAVGYQLMNQKRMKKAIEVFVFNTEEFSTSANTFDSLGEAYYRNNQLDLAQKSYEKAVALGGTDGNAKRMLSEIKK